MLDSLIFAVMIYLPVVVGSLIAPSTAGAFPDFNVDTSLGVAIIVATVIGFGVWLWLTVTYMHRNGQSIGKKLLAIKVIRADGTPVSLSRLFGLRTVVNGLISIIPIVGPIYGLVDVLFIFGESRQCLHDKILGTIVVKA
jgi:uncharacterized RDD family membrane protein YckC